MNVKQRIIVNIKTMNYMPAKKVSIYQKMCLYINSPQCDNQGIICTLLSGE